MALPTFPERPHPHGASCTQAPMTSLGNAVTPNTAACLIFLTQQPRLFSVLPLRQHLCISLWASDSRPQASNYKGYPLNSPSEHACPSLALKRKKTPSSPAFTWLRTHTQLIKPFQHISSQILFPLHNLTFFITSLMWMRGSWVFETLKQHQTCTLQLYSALFSSISPWYIVCMVWCWLSPNQDFNINLLL